MKEPLQPTPSSGFRVFNASLLSFLLIMMPFVQVAAATRQRSAVRDQRSESKATEGANSAADLFVNPPAMPLVGITATKTDNISVPAAPGDTITYTVDINNPTATDATGVTLEDIIDANTTRFGTDFDLKVSPLAINDTYSAEEGVALIVSAPGVLSNDTGTPAPTAVPIAAGPTTAGGTVTLNANGSFAYDPPTPIFTGPDSFTYTATNGQAPNDTATVSITVNPSNNPPVANNDAASASEAGGTTNGTPGTNPAGNLVTGTGSAGAVADTDVEDASSALTVVGVRTGPEGGSTGTGTVGNPLAGTYGSLTLNSNGSYTYTVDNNNATVQALRTSGDTVQDLFNYTIQDTGSLQDIAQFTVTIAGANDAPTDIAITASSVAENQPVNTVVGDFSTTDVDTGDTFTYTLVVGTGSTDNASFNISGNQLRTSASFNFEGQTSYSIRMRSTDAGGLFFEEIFTITVTNANETPTDIALSSNTVGENMAINTVIGNFSTTDPDAGDTFTYTLVTGTGDADNASFNISGNQLRTSAIFDFETDSSYSIRVRSTDAGSLFFEKQFTITIVNNNDTPTDIALSNSSVAENSAINTVVGNFSTTDQDGGTFTYTLVTGTGDTDNASFNINGAQLRTSAVFDFEADSSYSIRVRSTDTGAAFFEKQFTITVTDVAEAPVLTTSGGSASFTEDGPAVAVDAGITVADQDSATLASATIQITGNLQTTEDVLAFTNDGSTMGNIAVSVAYNPATGLLTLSSAGNTATLLQWQNALRAVTYNNTSQNPTTTARTVSFRVTDPGALQSNIATKGVTVTAVNDAPVLAAIEVGALTYTENDAATSITGTMTVADVDSATLSTATITISSNYQSSQDVLSFTNAAGMGNIAVQSNSGGVLTLFSAGNTATVAQWQTALRAVKYNNSSDDPNTSTRTVTFEVNDAGAVNNTSNTQARNITVVAVNDPPTANGFTNLPAQAGIPIAYPAAKLGGSDVEAGTTITIDTAPINVTNGTVAINANGSFTFTPLPGSVGTNTASFQYRVSDNGNPAPGVNSAYVTVSFTVAGPAIYFVRNPAVGSANCTLGNECLLATAVSNIGASTNARIFLEDPNNHAGTVPLNSGGWLIGQGVTGTTFDTLFGINPTPAQGTLAARPSLGLARPTVQNTVTLNASSSVRGLNISSTTNTGLADPVASISGVTVSEVAVTTTTATALLLSNVTTSTFSFTGLTTTGGAGLALTGTNTSSTFTFYSVVVSSGANVAFTATGGGTIEVCDENPCNPAATGALVNTLTTTTGTALSVNNTTISANKLEFKSIASNGAPNGIVLNTTGAGGLTVTGDGLSDTANTTRGRTTAKQGGGTVALGSGGIIQNSTGPQVSLNNAGPVILRNMTIQNTAGAVNDGRDGIDISNNTSALTLDNVLITGHANNHGIDGNVVAGLALQHCDIGNNATGVGVEGSDVWNVRFDNLTGTATVANSVFDTSRENVWGIVETGSSTLTMNVTNCLYQRANISGVGNDGISINANNTSNVSLNIQGSSFLGFFGSAVQYVGNDSSGGGTITVNNSIFDSFDQTQATNNGTEINIAHQGLSKHVEVNVTNNQMRQTNGGNLTAVSILIGSTGNASTTMDTTVSGNLIGNNADLNSGSFQGTGIFVNARAGTHNVLLSGNTVRQIRQDHAVWILNARELAAAPQPTMNVTINGNNDFQVGSTATNALAGLGINVGTGATAPDSPTMCLNMSGNTAFISNTGAPPANQYFTGFDLTVLAAGTVNLTGYGGAANNTAAINAFLQTRATTINPVANLTRAATATVQSGAACTLPLLLAPGGVDAVQDVTSLVTGFDSDQVLFPSLATSASVRSAVAWPNAPSNVVADSLSQQQLNTIVTAAIDRWAATGLTPQQVTTLRGINFDVADLEGVYLGEAGSKHVLIDRNAGGKGWYIGSDSSSDSLFGRAVSTTRRYTDPMSAPAGHLDLLTAIEHEMGHKLGLNDSYAERDRNNLMYGYLTVGERRVPAKGQAANAQAGSLAGTHFLKLEDKQKAEGSKQKAVSRNHVKSSRALAAPVSGETLTHVVGALPAGKSVRITFKVTINAGFGGPTVTNQGTVTGTLGGAFTISTDDPDVPPNTGETDPTVTQVVGLATANDDAYNAFKDTPLNVPAPGVRANDSNVTAVTGVGGCGDTIPPAFSGCATTGGGTVTVNDDGSFSYVPLLGFTGPDTFTYSVTGGTGTDTATVTITVADTSPIYLNEVLFHPDATGTNEYIELRGPISGLIPAGTYFVVVDGDAGSTAGDVTTIINLSGLSFGTNGFLVLLQNGNTYTTAAGATVITSTTTGFGGLGLPTLARWSADGGATSLENSGATFMLIQTGTAPSLSDDIDTAGDDGTPDGTVYAGWSVRDSVGHLTGANANDRAYGAINYITGGSGTGSGTVVTPSFISVYVGRICDSTGSTAADWVASDGLSGTAPNWKLGSNTSPASFAGNPLDHIGTTNFINNAPVNTVPGAQATNEDTALTFNAGNSNLISIADSDAGSNAVEVTLTATNGTMTLSGIGGLSFTTGDGTADATMVFTGTVTDINAALNGLTFTPTSNYSGPASVQIQTNDQGNTGGAACSTSQSATNTVNITVNGANDAPVLDNTGNMALNSIPQDVPAGSNPGTLVSDIILSAGGDRITDADAGALEGIAVTAIDNTNGVWEFSTNGGGAWTAFGSPSDSIARLLASDANTRVRFLPTLGFSGTVNPGITFRAWDQTSGTNGATGDASVNGGATAFSTATETASITVSSTVSIQDATVAEPASGTTNMVFTVTLNAPAAPGGASVQYATANGGATPATGGAACGGSVDYVTQPLTTLTFAAGEQVKSISVTVCSDGTVEDQTFLVNLSVPVNATIADGTATGTITAANTAGSILISELRTSGPGGATDEFVEIYNNSNAPHTVAASDASAGYGVFIMGTDCNATPILVGTIPNGTSFPVRGHYLLTGPVGVYSLEDYGGTNAALGDATLSVDIPNDANIAIFSTTDVSKLSTLTRYDAVGFGTNTGGNCDLLREGSNLPAVSGSVTEHSFFRKLCDFVGGCTTPGIPKDTNNNSVDFLLADTAGTDFDPGAGVIQRLGAPGPENLASPLKRDATIGVVVLDASVAPSSPPNRTRDLTSNPGNNSTFGTLSVRRRIVNNTGANVTRLRFRIVEMTTFPPSNPGTADLRALTSTFVVVSGVNDPTTCFASTGSAAIPCTVNVQGTTLEQPPTQTIGGGLNATLAAGTVTTGTPLAPGASVNVDFLLGVQQTGTFRFLIIVEALP